ncbi:MAG: hypothetical protein WCX28_07555 [Bacteriovoracaceae bacterium]|nr:hypothetical protein [Bacteroidota bacterium]
MLKTTEGSTGRLIQLAIGYFFFYVITGVTVKYFTGSASAGFPGMNQVEYLIYSTLGGNAIALTVALALRWYHLKSNGYLSIVGMKVPQEILYIIPSGICTAVVIPTTTMMYLLPISVMVAMVIMRASVIIISRIVDAIQIRQGILKKSVYPEENYAVVFALLAAAMNIFWVAPGDFDFVNSVAAVSILSSYIVVYSIRIYIMNYFKNTRAKGIQLDNKGFFAIEQITASIVMVSAAFILFHSPEWFQTSNEQLLMFQRSISEPHVQWGWGVIAGLAFGMVAFFSVFIFMFKGRTATFAGLVNRLTSLVAGTTATLASFFLFQGRFPKFQDWISLGFILIAVYFLSRAEKKRTQELVLAKEIELKG